MASYDPSHIRASEWYFLTLKGSESEMEVLGEDVRYEEPAL